MTMVTMDGVNDDDGIDDNDAQLDDNDARWMTMMRVG